MHAERTCNHRVALRSTLSRCAMRHSRVRTRMVNSKATVWVDPLCSVITVHNTFRLPTLVTRSLHNRETLLEQLILSTGPVAITFRSSLQKTMGANASVEKTGNQAIGVLRASAVDVRDVTVLTWEEFHALITELNRRYRELELI